MISKKVELKIAVDTFYIKETTKKIPVKSVGKKKKLIIDNSVTELVDLYGFEHLGYLIPINCFNSDPSIKSSLTFLRKTPWARKKVEDLYVKSLPKFSKL